MPLSARLMDRLRQILEVKRTEVARLREHEATLRTQAARREDFRDFRTAITSNNEVAVIAEIKKASPSAGVIAELFDSVDIARRYALGGASALSVLTDEQFFQGHLDYLRLARDNTTLPVLRKDFVIDELQVIEAAAAGADAILLIVAALTQAELIRFLAKTDSLQLDALVEVHTLEELDRALDADAEIIGINNRNLSTFEVDLSVTERLSEEVPDELTLVSESGIKTAQDVAMMRACGVNAVLVGESLMRGETTIDLLLDR